MYICISASANMIWKLKHLKHVSARQQSFSLYLKDAIDHGTVIESAVARTRYRCYWTVIDVFAEILRNSGAQKQFDIKLLNWFHPPPGVICKQAGKEHSLLVINSNV